MGVKPKAAPASEPHDQDAEQQRLPEADDGAPTLNLQSASVSGAPRSL
jgi:hypothetical protein